MPFHITIYDVIDIFLVAFLLYQLYRLIKGTPALSIFVAIFLIYLFWLLVRVLKLELVSTLLGQVIGVGVIALIIVFQQEIRKFLIVMGSRYVYNNKLLGLKKIFPENMVQKGHKNTEEIIRAVEYLSNNKIGALIVIGRSGLLEPYSEGGEKLSAAINASLLETIFTKNTPLHDGAVLIENGKIIAARCPLPITEQVNLPEEFGMRHRAALGMSEHTDALVIVVSEETGKISVADSGVIRSNISIKDLRQILANERI
ncbi:MAG TPA: diadenylate cyclase CdaA [Bacteroidales bacterium]|nr:diadenylate cyclase CdaA [Bacteroidales bacterium]